MLVMEEDKAGSGLSPQRNARPFGLAVTGLLGLVWLHCAGAAPRHFDLPAGDARVMLNRFGQQSDIQILFDFTQLTGKTSNEVMGDYEPDDALAMLLRGLPVKWTYVNDHTLALNLKTSERVRRWWQRVSAKHPPVSPGELDQVLIASTNALYQAPPIGQELIQLGQSDINNAGFATTQDFIHTLPQVFGGGPSEDTSINGREAPTNATKGSGINLRGLDAGATLVLIDGQRLAPSGGQGLYVDISNIPLSAIDHVDILPDGASAQYGADAIGGVVNFVLKSNFTGAETHLQDGDFNGNPLGGRVFSQLVGGHLGDSTTTMLGFEWYDRGALPASDRLQATSNLAPFGGTNFDVPYGSPGTILVGQQTWAIPAGATAASLASSHLVAGTENLYDQWAGQDALPDQERWSAFATLRSEIDDGLELSADSLFSRRRVSGTIQSDTPLIMTVTPGDPFYFNPTGGASPVTVISGPQAYFGPMYVDDSVGTGNFSVGLTWKFARAWNLNAHAGYTFENESLATQGQADAGALAAALADPDAGTALDPFADSADNNPSTLALIARTALYNSRSNIKIAGVDVAGTLFKAPGGDASLSSGIEYRRQNFDTSTWEAVTAQYPGPAPPSTPILSDLSRTVRAAFAEFRLPLFGPENSLRFLRALEISLGGRVEDYSDVGSAAVPKAGLLWSPAPGLTVRGTWTKAFRPPVLPDLVTNNSNSQILRLPDASSPTGATSVLLAYGNNPDLQDERARTWTLGTQFTPASVPGLSLALTYFNTLYWNRIETVALEPTVLNLPEFAWLVNRNFTAAQRDAICSQTQFVGVGSDCLDAQIGAIVDNRLHNVEFLQTRGFDLIGKYGFVTPIGRLEAGFNGSYLLAYSDQKTPDSPIEQLLNTQNNPINLRFRTSLSWERAAVGASLYVNFDNGYRDVLSDPNRNVRSFTTLDLQVRYQIGAGSTTFLANTEFAFTAQNVFNSSPPFLNNPVGVGYDQENADLTGRILSISLRKHW
jgi:iron complex outermembrane receptor protein